MNKTITIPGNIIDSYAGDKQIDFVYHLSEESFEIDADEQQMEQALINIIKNAIEARQDNLDSTVDVILQCQANLVLVEIRDNGSGIPEALGQSIFMPNFTTKSSGTGLGLAFVKQAIENIDGTISFNTFPGKGTTFFIRIPMMENNPPVAQEI